MKRIVIILMLLATTTTLLATQELHLFQQANEAYKRSEYSYAIEMYEQILGKGLTSAELHYNLANAYFKNNKIGPAILHYERALRLRPMNEDVSHNLAVARSRATDRVEQRPLLFYERWWKAAYSAQSVDGWAITSIIMLFLFFASLAIYLFSRSVSAKKSSFFVTVVFFIILVHAVIFTQKRYNRLTADHEAIIMQTRVTAKSSPAAQSPDLFLIHEGTKVTIRSALGEWTEIALPNGSVGWIKNENLEVI